MPQHIGIVACSAPGAALCYRTLCTEGSAYFGKHGHPEISMHSPSFAPYAELFETTGCDAVVLGCTELPLILNDENSALPTLDSTRLLARAALRYAASQP